MDAFPDKVTEATEPSPATTRPPRRRGPKTLAGKAKVRLNAVRHGIGAMTPVIPGVEQVEDWEAHRLGVVTSLAPVGYLETALAERVATALWRLRRVVAYEVSVLTPASGASGAPSQGCWLPPAPQADKIGRYEAHLSRQVYHALHELEALQARRRGHPTPLARRIDVHGPVIATDAGEGSSALERTER